MVDELKILPKSAHKTVTMSSDFQPTMTVLSCAPTPVLSEEELLQREEEERNESLKRNKERKVTTKEQTPKDKSDKKEEKEKEKNKSKKEKGKVSLNEFVGIGLKLLMFEG